RSRARRPDPESVPTQMGATGCCARSGGGTSVQRTLGAPYGPPCGPLASALRTLGVRPADPWRPPCGPLASALRTLGVRPADPWRPPCVPLASALRTLGVRSTDPESALRTVPVRHAD